MGWVIALLMVLAFLKWAPEPRERSKRAPSSLNLNKKGAPMTNVGGEYKVKSTDQVLRDFEASFALAIQQVSHFTPEYIRIWISRLKEARRLEEEARFRTEVELPEIEIDRLERRFLVREE